MNGHILVLGGARSGKTALAEKLALRMGDAPLYVATATAGDAEMAHRIAVHQQARDAAFTTTEAPEALAEALAAATSRHDVILVDCLSLWLANLMADPDADLTARFGALRETLDAISTKTRVILVSNEVGGGIVPENALARRFRDAAGLLHQKLAVRCGTVVLVTAGLPQVLKGQLAEIG